MRQDKWYWIYSAGIPVGFLLVLCGAVHGRGARRNSVRAAAGWFLPLAAIAVLLILGQAGYDRLGASTQRSISMGFFLLMSVFVWTLLIRSRFRQRQAGDPLLDLGRLDSRRKRGILAFLLVSMLLAGRSGVDAATAGLPLPLGAAETLMWVTAAFFWLAVLRNRRRLTPRGIVANGELIEWERVLSHEWAGEENERLLLQVRRQIPFFGARTGMVVLPVPPSARSALEGILARYAPSNGSD